MSYSFKKFLTVSACAALLPLSALSATDNRGVVVDTNKNIIKNTPGNCVRTKWDAGNDACNPEVAKTKIEKPHSRSYLVFFDFDKSTLSKDSLDILSNAVADAKTKRSNSFSATGHADRAGTTDYNVRLSERRANTVKEQIKKLHAQAQVNVAAKGESDPLVPTKDGVREPQNRRVEVIYYYSE